MSSIRRKLIGGVLAVGMASSIALSGAGIANAYHPQPPANPGKKVGQRAYIQSGQDPNIHLFTWSGSAWVYNGCWGSPYTNTLIE